MLLNFSHHHPTAIVDQDRLERLSEAALALVLASPAPESAAPGGCGEAPAEKVLPSLDEVEVSLVDDATIADIHGQFLDDPTPTDVITFHHGEILISLDTAARQAADHGESFEREVFRYVVHGLLHLLGHTDTIPAARTAMHAVQEEIVGKVWPMA